MSRDCRIIGLSWRPRGVQPDAIVRLMRDVGFAQHEVGRPSINPRGVTWEFGTGVLGIGQGTSRCSGPTYSHTGRISELAARCSMMCAVHPVIREATNSGVKMFVSKPIRWYAGPAG